MDKTIEDVLWDYLEDSIWLFCDIRPIGSQLEYFADDDFKFVSYTNLVRGDFWLRNATFAYMMLLAEESNNAS